MQPCSREMQGGLNSLMLNHSQLSLQDFHNPQIQPHFDPTTTTTTSSHTHTTTTTTNDDFLDQMLSSLHSSGSWQDLSSGGAGATGGGPNPKSPWDLMSSIGKFDDQFHFDESALLAAKLRQHQISGGGGGASSTATKAVFLQQQQQLLRGLRSPSGSSGAGESGLLPLPLSLNVGDDVGDGSSYKSPNLGGDNSVQALFNGFAGSLNGAGQSSNHSQHFHHPQAQNYGAPAPVMNQPAASGSAGGPPAQPRQRVRARRGQATDPHSIAERLRRERIAERMKALQELVPNANKTDKASMLDEIIDYVKFLQLQVKVLSMSRLGGASAVAPLVADMSSEGTGGGGDCIQTSGGGGGVGRSSNGAQTASANDNNSSMTMTEHQVAKLMEEDMGSAMQYLQGKGLCLMPISLATAISTATCNSSRLNNHHQLLASNGEGGPTSPNMSVLTVQSGTMCNGGGETSVKDANSVSKP